MRASDLEALADRITAPLTFSREGVHYFAIHPTVVNLLARGRPVSVEEIAAAAGKAPEDVRASLGSVAGVDWDEQGRVVGAGLSLIPTPHRLTVGGRTVFAWCATAALVSPAILGRPASIESPCRGTGQPVRIEVTRAEVVEAAPDSAVVSVVEPRDLASLRGVVCENVHFFSSPEAAARWRDEHPDATLLPVDEAFRLGQLIAERFQALSAVEG